MPKRVLQGVVVTAGGDKTIIVRVERRVMHPMYRKFIRRSKKYAAHDEANSFNPGDKVWFFPPPTSRIRVGTNTRKIDSAGPFQILRIGDRGGSQAVYGRTRTSRSNVVTVPLKFKNGKFDEKSQQLLDLLEYAGGQGLDMRVQSALKKEKE